METPRYYEAEGRGSDFLLRCADCKKLVTHKTLIDLGSCRCGNRRVTEINTLSGWEMLLIFIGVIRFPYRLNFLKEFTRASWF